MQTLLDIIKYFRGYTQQPMLKGSDENKMKTQTYLEILLRETRKKDSSQTTFLLLCCLALHQYHIPECLSHQIIVIITK